MLNSTATRIYIDQKYRKRAYAIEFISYGRTMAVGVRKELILCAGAINSPQLLLLSGIGPKEHLTKLNIPIAHHLPGVGKNLHNHVAYFLSFLLEKEPERNDLNCGNVLEYMLNHTGPMSSTGMSQVTGILNTKYADQSGDHPDLQMFFLGYLASCASSCEADSTNELDEGVTPRNLLISPVVLHPKSKGDITLRSKNPSDPPVIKVNYLTEPEDMATLIEGVRLAQKFANASVLQDKYGIKLNTQPVGECGDKHDFDSDEYWECAIRQNTVPENHQVGSCKMGPSTDSMAVVSPELKVHGVEGLRVADASVIPMITSGNTASPVMMIGEQAAHFIRKRWERGLRRDNSWEFDWNDFDENESRKTY